MDDLTNGLSGLHLAAVTWASDAKADGFDITTCVHNSLAEAQAWCAKTARETPGSQAAVVLSDDEEHNGTIEAGGTIEWTRERPRSQAG